MMEEPQSLKKTFGLPESESESQSLQGQLKAKRQAGKEDGAVDEERSEAVKDRDDIAVEEEKSLRMEGVPGPAMRIANGPMMLAQNKPMMAPMPSAAPMPSIAPNAGAPVLQDFRMVPESSQLQGATNGTIGPSRRVMHAWRDPSYSQSHGEVYQGNNVGQSAFQFSPQSLWWCGVLLVSSVLLLMWRTEFDIKSKW
jgi:hypothetical protein